MKQGGLVQGAETERQSKIVPLATKFWIFNGFLWLALIIYVWGSWLLGPHFVTNTIGREQAPQSYVHFTRGAEVVSVIVMFVVLYIFVCKPLLTTRKLPFDGFFLLATWSIYFQEPWMNYINYQVLYSTTFVNFGSWCGYIPGWNSPNPELIPMSVLAVGPIYLWLVAFPPWFGCKFMTWLKGRYPEMGNVGLVGTTLLAFMVFDVCIEVPMLWAQLYNYASTIPAVTLFAGTKYQYPIYQMFHWAGLYAALACVLYYRDDMGRSFVERGLDNLRVSARSKSYLRFVTLLGAAHMCMFVIYDLPMQIYGLNGGAYPNYEEYRTAGLCGPKTNYDCPGPGVPIPRRDSPTNRIGVLQR